MIQIFFLYEAVSVLMRWLKKVYEILVISLGRNINIQNIVALFSSICLKSTFCRISEATQNKTAG